MLEIQPCSFQVCNIWSSGTLWWFWTSDISNGGCFAGWGKLVFFDLEEHQIPSDKKLLAKVSKLGTQWKVIHEFKATEYLQETEIDRFKQTPTGLCMAGGRPVLEFMTIGIWFPNIILIHSKKWRSDIHAEPLSMSEVKNTGLPEVGVWTKIEISHEEVDGEYILSLSVGGKEVGRMEADPGLKQMTDFEVGIGSNGLQPGFIRRLVVLEKE